MASYAWHALDQNGKKHKGISIADSPKSLRRTLRQDGLLPTKVEISNKKKNKKIFAAKTGIKKIPVKDVVAITRQFSTLLASGLPIDASLNAMISQSKKANIKNLLTSILTKVKEGFTFAQALKTYPHIFPNYYTATVATGEKTGNIHMVLQRLGEYLHISHTTNQKITSALLYPAIITIVAIGVIIAMITFVVPSIVEVFANVEQELPLLTISLIALSDFLVEWGLTMLITLLFALIGFRLALINQKFKFNYHKFLLKIPVYGNLVSEQSTSRFIRTLGILLESQVDFYEAMHIATNIVDILPIKQALQESTKMVKEGSSVFVALNKTNYFSPISLSLIASGEQSSNLPKMLRQCAENQEQENLNFINLLVNAFEPIIILVMGGIVLTIVMAILVPIFDMNNLIQ